jgi:hypothetical protein
MEAARLGAQSSHLYGGGLGELDLNSRGKRVFGWDLNDWSWDSERFVATPVPASVANGLELNSSPSSSEEAEVVRNDAVRGDSDKRKRVIVIDEDDTEDHGLVENSGGALSLRIGGDAVGPRTVESGGINEERNGKKIKMQGGSSSGPACQVQGCGADLAAAKDYHRRHKVCEMHAKANTAVVGNTVQRFCQQCSRLVYDSTAITSQTHVAICSLGNEWIEYLMQVLFSAVRHKLEICAFSDHDSVVIFPNPGSLESP